MPQTIYYSLVGQTWLLSGLVAPNIAPGVAAPIGSIFAHLTTGLPWSKTGLADTSWSLDTSGSTGPAGPTGATGPAGPAGPTGATGPAGPWTKTGAVITEVVPTDQVVIGAAAPIGTAPLEVQGHATVGDPNNPVSHFYVNQIVADHGSSADLQVSSLVANAPSLRCNQYGANAGIPGMSTIKSRGLAIGSLVACAPGDVLFRVTAVGVPTDGVSVPLAGMISIKIPAGGVGANYVATDFEIQLVPLAGPINGRKQAFMVDSEGVLHVKESANTMAGIAILDGTGTAVVNNTRVTATTKFNVTGQDGGSVQTGAVFQASRVIGTSFTIKSTAGAGDSGVHVYYQLFEPTIP